MAGMPQQPAAVFLALLIALPAVGPVAASEAALAPSPASATLPLTAPDRAATPSIQVSSDPSDHGRPDTTGRYIVILKDGADTAAVADKARRHDAVHADHSFGKAVKGFAAKLDAHQKHDIAADPNVVAIVPDEVIQITAQVVPTGVSRINGRGKDVNRVNPPSSASRTNVDADVAIVDTGIGPHPDLNIAGGYNCSTTDHSAWRDKESHGTHVAGTVGAINNDFGVVGVAPGVRVWGVKILNDDGYGLLSWYVCGLDWVLAQKDPKDPTRPLFEAVNMSVTKPGSDDHNCGNTNNDILHKAVCRVVAGGITIVAAAANDHHNASQNIPASYDEVTTVSALADTDGKAGGLGGNRCYSWGGYDKDDTFADFSNYGADVDIIAPGKCIWSTIPGPSYKYMSGTSMAAPAVTGAVALYKASRPKATPAEVKEALRYLGNFNWKTTTDPDSMHEPLLDVSRIWALGTFSIKPSTATPPKVEAPLGGVLPITVGRSATFFERVRLSITAVPAGLTASLTPSSLVGWTATQASIAYTVAAGTPPGIYQIGVQGTNQGRTVTASIPVEVVQDLPTTAPPVARVVPAVRAGMTMAPVTVSWPAATDTSGIAGYELQVQRGTSAWGGTVTRTGAQRDASFNLENGIPYMFRVRARDNVGNWGDWTTAAAPTIVSRVDDRSSSIKYTGAWSRALDKYASSGTYTTSGSTGSIAAFTFTGRGISFVGRRTSTYGYAEIFIDGAVAARVNVRAAPSGNRWIVFDRRFAASGTHTIWVRVYGGTPRGVGVDAFLVTK
jgi:subtilisin family serine protease